MPNNEPLEANPENQKKSLKYGNYALFLTIAKECGFYQVLQEAFPNNYLLLFSLAQFFTTNSLKEYGEYGPFKSSHYTGLTTPITYGKVRKDLDITIRNGAITKFNELWIKAEQNHLSLADKQQSIVIYLTENFYVNKSGTETNFPWKKEIDPYYYYTLFLSHATLVPLAFYKFDSSPFYPEMIADINRYCRSLKITRPLFVIFRQNSYERSLFSSLNKYRCLYLDDDISFVLIKQLLIRKFIRSKNRAEGHFWSSDVYPQKILNHSFRVLAYRYLSDFLRVCKNENINPEWHEPESDDPNVLAKLKLQEKIVKQDLLYAPDSYFHLVVTTDKELPIQALIRDQRALINFLSSYCEKTQTLLLSDEPAFTKDSQVIFHFAIFLGMILKREVINYLKPLNKNQDGDEFFEQILQTVDSIEIERNGKHWVKSAPLTEDQKDIFRELLISEQDLEQDIAKLK